jgi:acetyl esterase/lipase
MNYAFDAELVPLVSVLPRLDLGDIGGVRAMLLELRAMVPRPAPVESVSTQRRTAPGTSGEPDVEVCLITPDAPGTDRPALLWMHGGGFVMGDIDSDIATIMRIAAEVDAVVVSVAYRLAPEHPYPAAVVDCCAALDWLLAHAGELGVDADRIGVGGISAGGGLAAAVALANRDRGGPRLCLQVLETPVLDDRCDSPSMRRFVDTPLWTQRNARLSWDAYLGPLRSNGAPVPALAAPARADDVSGLPPAYVVTCEFDPLRDEGIDYAHRLMQAGVPVELHSYAGTFHGCPGAAASTAIAARMVADRLGALRRGLSA